MMQNHLRDAHASEIEPTVLFPLEAFLLSEQAGTLIEDDDLTRQQCWRRSFVTFLPELQPREHELIPCTFPSELFDFDTDSLLGQGQPLLRLGHLIFDQSRRLRGASATASSPVVTAAETPADPQPHAQVFEADARSQPAEGDQAGGKQPIFVVTPPVNTEATRQAVPGQDQSLYEGSLRQRAEHRRGLAETIRNVPDPANISHDLFWVARWEREASRLDEAADEVRDQEVWSSTTANISFPPQNPNDFDKFFGDDNAAQRTRTQTQRGTLHTADSQTPPPPDMQQADTSSGSLVTSGSIAKFSTITAATTELSSSPTIADQVEDQPVSFGGEEYSEADVRAARAGKRKASVDDDS